MDRFFREVVLAVNEISPMGLVALSLIVVLVVALVVGVKG